ncbi:MAG: hypothetical protein K2Z81_13330 [Cyanobacteria bacterium]|nr:hypothetical protein [Cyanobacteriota bacterium]
MVIASKLKSISIFAVAFAIGSTLLVACNMLQPDKEQSLNANIDVKVHDKTIRALTEITQSVKIKATGRFKKGVYFVDKIPILVPEATDLQLDVTIPIDDPAVISTRSAEGTLHTSRQLSAAGVPLPCDLRMKGGKVVGRVDLARTTTAFFFNLLQVGASTKGMGQMLDSVELKNVRMDLRPGSSFKVGKKIIHIDPHSSIELRDAHVNSDLTFSGVCSLDLTFGKNCKWIGEAVDCEFEGGHGCLELQADKSLSRHRLDLKKGSSQDPIRLEDCLIRFGKNKRSQTQSAKAAFVVKELWWQQTPQSAHPSMHLVSSMDLTDTDLKLKTDIHQTNASFPQTIPGILKVDIADTGRSLSFQTTTPTIADSGTITINKKNTKLVLRLSKVKVGTVEYDKFGKLHFALDKGIANINSFEWSGGKSDFVLECSKGSLIKIPQEMLIEKSSSTEPMHVNLPLELTLNSAKLRSRGKSIALSNLNGDVSIVVEPEIHVTSNLDFTLGKSQLLGGYGADVAAHGMELAIRDGEAGLHVDRCTVMVPNSALDAAIKTKLPETLSFDLNKTIKEEKKWRYRNTIAKTVKVEHFKLLNTKTLASDKIGFSASGDVTADGTIEKSGLVINKDEWETRPWRISGSVRGDGSIKYAFVDGKGKNHSLKYDLKLDVPVPDDVELDWSKVASGLLKVAEKKIIVGHLKKLTIPITYSGEISVFNKAGWMSNLRITKLAVKDAVNEKKLEFSASYN